MMNPSFLKISRDLTLGRLAVLIAACLSSVYVSAQCLKPSSGDLYVDKDASSASDSNNGVLQSEGGSGPFATIQRLVNVIQPGQCGWVMPTDTPYMEVGKVSGAPIAGITFSRGGSSESQRIIISGYPGDEKPVIDQGRVTPSGSWGAAGFYIFRGSYITVRNFEIRNTTMSSIHVDDGAGANYAVFENNHLHHSWATENAGGVRLDHCDNCTVRNNVIHHHYRSLNQNSNLFDSVSWGLNAGVHGFEPGNCVIENNLIYNVDKGVQLKQSDRHFLDAHKVSGNIFVNMAASAYNMQLQGAGLVSPLNSEFYNNIVYNAPVAVATSLHGTSSQARGLKIYNNTLLQVQSGIGSLGHFEDVEIYNNLVAQSTNFFTSAVGSSKIFVTDNPSPYNTTINYFDHNLYHDVSLTWNLGRDTFYDTAYHSLSSWANSSSTPEMVYSNPDANSLNTDPRFVNESGGTVRLLTGDPSDYALSANSPALNAGRFGATIGAVRDGVVVGLLSSSTTPVAITADPSAPPGFTVQPQN